MSRKGRVNVGHNQQKIIESIAKSEPYGRYTIDIANDTKLHRDTVFRLCTDLKKKNYIFKENKQAPYHILQKAYSFPTLTASLFGNEAIRSIRNNPAKWICRTNVKFCNAELCKKIILPYPIFFGQSSSAPHSFPTNNNDDTIKCFLDQIIHSESYLDQITLFELALRLGALIEYIMIQALSPKKLSSDDIMMQLGDISIKGQDKNKISYEWVNNAIKPEVIFSEFCRLWVVERGLAVFADKDNTSYMDPSLPPNIQRKLIAKRKKIRQMDINDPYWSSFEMDKENYQKLVDAYQKTFPDSFHRFQELGKKIREDIDWYYTKSKTK